MVGTHRVGPPAPPAPGLQKEHKENSSEGTDRVFPGISQLQRDAVAGCFLFREA